MNSLYKYCVILLAVVGCQTTRIQTSDIPNFSVIDEKQGIYRGGQPNEAGWAVLNSLGVTNVVKLNLNKEGVDMPVVGAVYFYPINKTQQIITGPDSKEVWEAVSHIVPKTYVHCLHGQDRTGLVVACYRLKNGASKAQAEKEMLEHGFHKELEGLWIWWKVEALKTMPKVKKQ